MASAEERLRSIGLDEKQVKNILSNSKLTSSVLSAIAEAGVDNGCDRSIGNLIFNAATNLPASVLTHRPFLLSYIKDKIKTNAQLEDAIKYLRTLPEGSEPNVSEFESSCGANLEITPEFIQKAVEAEISKFREELESERYLFNVGKIMFALKETPMKWADGKLLKAEVDSQILNLLGPQTEQDKEVAKNRGKKKEKKEKPTEEKKQEAKVQDFSGDFGERFSNRDLVEAKNSKRLLDEHRKIAGTRMFTRFPPEPNGFLHIGHAKAINFNFEGAYFAFGQEPHHCVLRYDDTNPETETPEYIESILDNVRWLGFEPVDVTFSSQYFDQLYEYAVQLIHLNKAYVCHQTEEEIRQCRDFARHRNGNPNSPWRDRPIEENLRLFEDMKKGKFEEGEACLRMKIDMFHNNPCMWDPVAYRVRYTPHPHSGDEWCIYPTYDFTHCLVDSIEHITHSLCTLEFEVRRDSYYWLLEALDIWRPHQWEYARLNISRTVLSKRKLLRLVNEGHVNGWDDPRLYTINGLRRRGYTPEGINNFCRDIGVTRNQNVIDYQRLDYWVRDHLDKVARRAMAVFDPVKVTITTFSGSENIRAPNFPREPERGVHYKDFNRIVYINRSDIRMESDKDFFGLVPGGEVRLKYAYVIKATEIRTNDSGMITEVFAEHYPEEPQHKVKGTIHWVCGPTETELPEIAEVRVYEPLFTSEEPGASPNWLNEINTDSLHVIPRVFVDKSLRGSGHFDKFQFERVGFFCVDPDSMDDKLVFNRTLPLKDSYHR